jgi:hypothetical protein
MITASDVYPTELGLDARRLRIGCRGEAGCRTLAAMVQSWMWIYAQRSWAIKDEQMTRSDPKKLCVFV